MKLKTAAQFRAALQDDGTLELLVYGEVVDASTMSLMESYGYDTDGFVSESSVKKAIDAAGAYSAIRVRINSPGGDAFSGIAIHNLLRAQGTPVETCVDGVAASSASIIAVAGDVRSMGDSTMLMIHNAWSYCSGDASAMLKMADTLDKVSGAVAQTFVDRSGKSVADIKALMDAETWLSADECVAMGLATTIAAED